MGSLGDLRVVIFGSFAILFSSCKPRNPEASDVQSLKSGVDCVDMSNLDTSRLEGVRITDLGIENREKIRHLNELNKMPEWYIAAIKPHVEIVLGPYGYGRFPGNEWLRGIRPTGWPPGFSWDDVAGGTEKVMTDGVLKVRLGPSNLANGSGSVAIHEASHGIDFSFGITKSSSSTIQLFNELKALPNPGEHRTTYNFRFSHITEFFATAMDDYFCNATTNAKLKSLYPKIHSYIENQVPVVVEFFRSRKTPLKLVGTDNQTIAVPDATGRALPPDIETGPSQIASSDLLLQELFDKGQAQEPAVLGP